MNATEKEEEDEKVKRKKVQKRVGKDLGKERKWRSKCLYFLINC